MDHKPKRVIVVVNQLNAIDQGPHIVWMIMRISRNKMSDGSSMNHVKKEYYLPEIKHSNGNNGNSLQAP